MSVSDDDSSLGRPFGFLFIYGPHGEGENLGELMESMWKFTSRLEESIKDCTVVVTELGLGDPLANHVPQTASMSCIHDLWFTRKLSSHSEQKVELLMKKPVGNVFDDILEIYRYKNFAATCKFG